MQAVKGENLSNHFKVWKFGTINIRTGDEKSEGAKMYMVANEIDKAGLTFCCLQEVRHRGTNKKLIRLQNGNQFVFMWCGKKKRRDAGVGILIRVGHDIEYSEPDISNPRLLAIDLKIYGFKIRVVNVYSPTNVDGTQNQKDEFYRHLKKACIKKDRHQKLIIAGDFNAQTSVVLRKCSFDENSVVQDNECNENGERLKSFCKLQKLKMLQTFFDHPTENRYTWFSNDGTTKKVLDYILTERFVNNYTENCFVDDVVDIESDHRLVVAVLNTPRSKRARWKKQKLNKSDQVDVSSLANKDVQNSFKLSVERNFVTSGEQTACALSENIINSLCKNADNVLPKKTRHPHRELWKEDEDFNQIIHERSLARRYSEEYKLLTKKLRKRIRFLRNEKLRQEANDINMRAQKREIEALFRSFKDDKSNFASVRNEVQCEPAKLKTYFIEHFNTENLRPCPIELINAPVFVRNLQEISIASINTEAPSKDEILSTIKKLKTNKAASDLPVAYLKYAVSCNCVLDEMKKLMDTIWMTNKTPKEWSHSKLVALWKGAEKGKATEPTSYRGIQIGSTMCKILTMIILARLNHWYDNQLSQQQQGFRQGKGTTDGIFILKQVQQISYKRSKPVFALFVDLTAAFDHVNRDWMFKTITQRMPSGTDNKLISLLKSIYEYTTTALAQTPEDAFETVLGVRQGGPESPSLYNLYMDYVMRVFVEKCSRQDIQFFKSKYCIPGQAVSAASASRFAKYGNLIVDWIGYADDLVIFFESSDHLEKGMKLLSETFTRFNLQINVTKTKTMILNFAGENYPDTIVKLNESEIKNVESFRYLGCQINFKQHGTGEEEINLRVDSATTKLYSLGKKFFNQKIHLTTRVNLLNSLVRSRLTYACPTWLLTSSQLDRIAAQYNLILRKIIRGGFSRKPENYSFVYTNQNIYDICKTTPLRQFIAQQQRKFIAHIIRLDDDSVIKKLLFNAEISRVPGRQMSSMQQAVDNEEVTVHEFVKRAIEKRY